MNTGIVIIVMLMVVESELVKGVTQLIEGHDPTIQHVMPHASHWRRCAVVPSKAFFT
jgi:hypothetical protein